MSFSVSVTDDAVRDLEEIYDYVARHDSQKNANSILDRFDKSFRSLSQSPERGAYPKELLSLGIREYREIFFKPYRIVYRVLGDRVIVMLIADGRRDMETLLQRRLLEN